MKKEAEYVFNGLINVPNIDIEYRGYHIVPKRDFGGYPFSSNGNTYRRGYVVVQGCVNVMPGATWSSSVIEAKAMIDSYIEADGDNQLFWEIHRKKQGRDEYQEV